MACVFPDAADLETFWANIVNGVDSITEVPKGRWDTDLYYDPNGRPGEKTPSKWGGFVPDIDFDPMIFGLPPRSLSAIEPVQLLSLEVARRALDDAGYADRDFNRERTSVIFGAEAGTDLANSYSFRANFPQFAGPLPRALDEALPSLTEDSFPGVLSNVIAGRIANRLNLGGANYTVDAACASSLAAVNLACKDLVTHSSDMVVCGGADLHNSIADYLLFSSVHALSPTGSCKTFDAEADGIVLGEGVGVVVLKRLDDAERDGDRIYAVIRGIGASSDGRSSGLIAPRKEGQVLAIQRALDNARLSPLELGLIEAHGTGTVVGDATELATLTDIFSRAGTSIGSCRIGSVKSQIGHTKCAAGMAGMIKVALALHRGVLPPTLNIRCPNPSYDSSKSPFSLAVTAQPWLEKDRKAGVSAFGFGGTNFHTVLSLPDSAHLPASGNDQWPAELFLFRGKTQADALALAAKVERWLLAARGFRLRDLAYSTTASSQEEVQIALVADNAADLKEKLSRLPRLTADEDGIFFANPLRGSIAIVFPGQGSQRPGMLAELFVAFPSLRRYLTLGSRWHSLLFPPSAFSDSERSTQAEAITDTRVAQPTLGMVNLAVADLLHQFGIREDMLGGHSYGELVALAAAGAISESDILRVSEARGRCILEAAGADAGRMAAVKAPAETIEQIIADFDGVVVANRNAPEQQVIAGPSEVLAKAVERIREAGLSVHTLPVACAFHSPLIAKARETFERELADLTMSAPRTPVWSNATASRHDIDTATIRKQLADQLVRPVVFQQQIEAMYEAGARIFIEAGPGRVLTGLIGSILSGKPHLAAACDQPGQSALRQLLVTLGQVSVCGVELDAEALFAGRETREIDLDVIKTVSTGMWIVNGHRARPIRGELPEFAMKPLTTVRVEQPSSREAAISEYLRGMREVVKAQHDVMLRYLGTDVPAPAALVHEPVRRSVPDPAQNESVEQPATECLDPTRELLAIVSRHTGYPTEMLDLDLDIEADLSIDSIKRMEIIGALAERLGLRTGKDGDGAMEQLAPLKTLRGILKWLESAVVPCSGDEFQDSSTAPRTIAQDLQPPATETEDLRRFRFTLERTPAAAANVFTLQGRHFVLTEDSLGVWAALLRKLQADGASTEVANSGSTVQRADGLIHLASLSPDHRMSSVNELFGLTRTIIPNGATYLLAATAFGGTFGIGANEHLPLGGVAGFVKSVAREWPVLHARVVDLDPRDSIERLAAHLYAELLADDGLVEVGYAHGVRQVRRLSQAKLPERNGAMPELGPESPVLVTGGARGITAAITVALAQRYRCRLELVGRSPLPNDTEDREIAAAATMAEIRHAIIRKAQITEPGDIESAARQTFVGRRIRETLAALRNAGSQVTYHSVDVRNRKQFEGLIDSIYSRYGRIDGVIHGAGIIEDRLLADKTADSFQRVFETKVGSALTLAEKIRPDVKFVIFFSSVAGVFGNRGQTDYAAASDALDKLAHSLAWRVEGRVTSINWGPWAGAGMVSSELQRTYERRGIQTIALEGGVKAFFDELSKGSKDDVQVAWLGSNPEVFG
jgi:acyl transferase domain-containing protein/NAD(P)-dependent dehydrogenase (short-subunit alcohol dehydrogenase family)